MKKGDLDTHLKQELAAAIGPVGGGEGGTTSASIGTHDALVAPIGSGPEKKKKQQEWDTDAPIIGVVRRVWPMEDAESGPMFSIDCPECMSNLRVFPNHDGESKRCPGCKKMVRLPEDADLSLKVSSEIDRQVAESYDIAQGKAPDNSLSITPTRQTTSFCGPAALQCILTFFGATTTEDEVAKAGGATHTEGISPEGILKAARFYGMKANYRENGSSSDLRRLIDHEKIPILVFWYGHGRRGDGGHASVVVGYDDKNVYLMDPEPGLVVPKLWEKFMSSWFSFDGNEPGNDHLHVGEYFLIAPWEST